MARRANEDIAWIATELDDLALLLRVHRRDDIAQALDRARLLLKGSQRLSQRPLGSMTTGTTHFGGMRH